jgi:hypothetical protein
MAVPDAGDDDDDFPTQLIGSKRTHSGTVKFQNSDGKLIAAFWARIASLLKRKTKLYGTDLQSEGWTGCVLLVFFTPPLTSPTDISIIVSTKSGYCTPPTSSRSLSGVEVLLPHPWPRRHLATCPIPAHQQNLRVDPVHPSHPAELMAVHKAPHLGLVVASVRYPLPHRSFVDFVCQGLITS